MPRKLTTAEFIGKAKSVHGDQYDYSRVQYQTAHKKIMIICHNHGKFKQTPNNHLKGHGCDKCHHDKRTTTTKEFIEKAKSVHGNLYDYSKVDYKHSGKKVIITCPNHGEFKQIANNHLKGHGCDKCGATHKLDTALFVQRAQDIHGNFYDYSRVDYKYSGKKVIIICPDHGKFKQTPNNHLQGQNCPECSRKNPSKGETEVHKWLKDHDIRCQREWVIPNSRNKRFDFYLPDYNTFIEYDGIQHFTGWGGKIANLVKKQKNDKWKNEWAEKNGYNLIRVPYYEDVSESLAAYFDV